jgi:hypothetical protein
MHVWVPNYHENSYLITPSLYFVELYIVLIHLTWHLLTFIDCMEYFFLMSPKDLPFPPDTLSMILQNGKRNSEVCSKYFKMIRCKTVVLTHSITFFASKIWSVALSTTWNFNKVLEVRRKKYMHDYEKSFRNPPTAVFFFHWHHYCDYYLSKVTYILVKNSNSQTTQLYYMYMLQICIHACLFYIIFKIWLLIFKIIGDWIDVAYLQIIWPATFCK